MIKQREYKMPKKVLEITTHLPAIPEWLKINNSITIPLPLKSAKELAKKLLEVQEDVEIRLNFATGKKTTVEIELNLSTVKENVVAIEYEVKKEQ
jgi:hypothetical protein